MNNRIGDYIAEIELGSEDDYYRYDGGDHQNLDVSVALDEKHFEKDYIEKKVSMKWGLLRNVIFFAVFSFVIYLYCEFSNPYRAKKTD